MKTLAGNFYEQVFAGARVALLVIEGRHGSVADANAAAGALLGYPVEQLVGKSFLDLVAAERRSEILPLLDDVWDEGGAANWDCPLQRSGGSTLEASLTAHVWRHDDEMYLTLSLRDNTAARQTEAELRRQNDELVATVSARTAELVQANAGLQHSVREANRNAKAASEAMRAESRFAANLTHELRTPLNALIGMSTLLTDMELDDEARAAAEIVASSAQGLLRLVNDVLDYAKIEAGEMTLRQEPFDLAQTLQGVQDTFALTVAEKGLCFYQELADQVPSWLIGDEGRIRQILLNLVSNAVKFTEEGSVTVKVSLSGQVGHRVKLNFSVADTGCGIAGADQAQLFDAFKQVAGPRQDQLAGTGLGLNISREIVRKMGGRFHLDSTEGRGSTFSFDVQFAVGSAPDAVSAEHNELATAVRDFKASASRSVPSDLHVLVAEDNKVNQTVALGMIRKIGFTGVAADDGRQALELLAGGQFDLVFMDVQMPELDGLSAAREIRSGAAGPSNRDIPIIAMTGRASREDRLDCLEAGMNDYITKPISSERILEAIANLSAPTSDSREEMCLFSLARLVDQMNGDTDLAVEILEIFRADTAERLHRIEKAVRRSDFAKVGDEAFAIESGALNVGATTLVELAQNLQTAATNGEQVRAGSLVDEMSSVLEQMLQGA